MPVPPAELTAHFRAEGPEGVRAAVLEAVQPSGLAREAGPDELMLAGPRGEVLEALTAAISAALDAGASALDVKLEAPTEARR